MDRFSRRQTDDVSYFSPENRTWHFMQIETGCIKCQITFPKKKLFQNVVCFYFYTACKALKLSLGTSGTLHFFHYPSSTDSFKSSLLFSIFYFVLNFQKKSQFQIILHLFSERIRKHETGYFHKRTSHITDYNCSYVNPFHPEYTNWSFSIIESEHVHCCK